MQWSWENHNWSQMIQRYQHPITNLLDFDCAVSSATAHLSLVDMIKIGTISCALKKYNESTMVEKISLDLFYKKILPQLQQWVVNAPLIFSNDTFRSLEKNQNNNIYTSRYKIVVLLSTVFLGVYRSDITSLIYLESHSTLLHSLLHYFYHAILYTESIHKGDFYNGIIIVKRTIANTRKFEDCKNPVNLFFTNQPICNIDSQIQIVFSKNIQPLECNESFQSIVCRPELLYGSIVCSNTVLSQNESICIFGAERMFIFENNTYNRINDNVPFGQLENCNEILLQNSIIYIKPLEGPIENDFSHFNVNQFRFNSAIGAVGTAISQNLVYSVSGTECFGRNSEIILLHLAIAAACNNRTLVWFLCNNSKLLECFKNLLHQHNIRVCELYHLYQTLITQHNKISGSTLELFEPIKNLIMKLNNI